MKPTQEGYINCNQQKNLGDSEPRRRGNNPPQWLYVMHCLLCGGENYGSNGGDVWERKCPHCQGGKKGPKLNASELARRL